MSNTCKKSCRCGFLWSVVAGLVFIALFAIIVDIAYLPTRKNVNAARAVERKTHLEDLEAKQTRLATTYGWVNQQEGVVRLPLNRAMELTAQELQQR